jgi:hypothetical protein
MSLAEEGITIIGSTTTRGAATTILTFKSEPTYLIDEPHKEESSLKDLKHQTLAER